MIHVHKVLQRLLENRLFIKAEKCEFSCSSTAFLGYIISTGNLSMDPEKVRAVEEWPKPADRKALQRFLGFINFYRRFIRNYSTIAAPLTHLTSTKINFCWDQDAERAFIKLKRRFTTAPILVHPDSDTQFIVEVDAANVRVGTILSQHSAGDSKVHPCAFYSHQLSPNYGIGNKELLAVKLAPEEWPQWLEGAQVPFQVWTDHKNLEYLQTAKRLNSRQARWALFFSRFNFHLAYLPGSKNVKPDALSRYFEGPTKDIDPDTILRPEVFIHAVELDIEKTVQEAFGTEAAPSRCPEGRLYVPANGRSQVIQWGHSSQLSGHPGTNWTTSFIQRKFWWPEMREDIQNFVSACSVWGQAKVTHQPPGLTATTSHPSQTMVTYSSRFRHRAPHLQPQHHHPHYNRQIFQRSTLHHTD